MTASFASNELAALLARSAWFRSAPAAMRAPLLEAGRVEHLAPGERLFTRGDSDDGLYCVLDGPMRIGAASSSGKEALLAVIEPVNCFGEIALFDNRARTHDAYAERDSALFHVPCAALGALLERTPEYWHAFGLLLTQKLRLAFDAIEEAALQLVACRAQTFDELRRGAHDRHARFVGERVIEREHRLRQRAFASVRCFNGPISAAGSVEISVCSVKSRSSRAMSSSTRISSRTVSVPTTYTPSGE